MRYQVKDAKRAVYDCVKQSADDAGGETDLDALSARMVEFSDAELRLTILMEGVVRDDIWPIAIALARGELERREAADTKTLAYRTTIISAAIGVFAALVGTWFGAWLTN